MACGEARTIADLPDAGQGGGDGEGGGDAGTDGGEEADGGPSCNGPTCSGDCVPFNPFAGEGVPVLLRIGPDEANTPPCPEAAPVEQATGHGNLTVEESSCPLCTCGPSTGSCALSSSIVAQASICNGDESAPTTPTNAPAAWDGSCSSESPIPAGLACNDQPCVQSVTVGALAKNEACAPAPSMEQPSFPSPTWGLFGRVCGYAEQGCGAGSKCIPSAPGASQQCLAWPGEQQCPTTEYTERIVLYEGLADTRTCTPCACGPPAGSLCTSLVTFYEDDACQASLGSVEARSSDDACLNVISTGLAIGSKSATPPLYQPGACAPSGGQLGGAVTPLSPLTLCCLDLRAPH